MNSTSIKVNNLYFKSNQFFSMKITLLQKNQYTIFKYVFENN